MRTNRHTGTSTSGCPVDLVKTDTAGGKVMGTRRRVPAESKGRVVTRSVASHRGGEEGFTLIEILIVLLILPLVVGGVVAALLSILQNEDTTFNRVGDSADAQITSAYFVRDVQNATSLSTGNSTSGTCSNTPSYPPLGSTPIVNLQWGETNFRTITDAQVDTNFTLTSPSANFSPADGGATVSDSGTGGLGYIKSDTVIVPWNSANPPDSSTTVELSQKTTGSTTPQNPDTVTISLTNNWEVTYWTVPVGSTHELVRMFCGVQNHVPTFESKEVLAHDLPANQGAATITCGPTIPSVDCTPSYLSNNWISTAGVSDVSISAAEPASGYDFDLSATPRNANPTSEEASSGAVAATGTLLVAGSGPSYLSVPNTGDVLTVNGGLAFNSPTGSVTGAGTLVATAGPITEFNCDLHGPDCPQVTSNALFTGTCTCAMPTTTTAPIPPIVAPPPTSPTPTSGPTGSCTVSGSTMTCQPGYYANPVAASGGITTVTFSSGNYLFNGPVTVTTSTVSSVTFGAGQYTFDSGLTIGPNIGVTGSEVSFYFAGTTASLSVGTGDTVNLTAPTSGPYLGVLVYQPATNLSPMDLGSGGAQTVNTFGGAVEAWGAPVVLGSNGDDFTVSALVAASVTLGSSNVTVTVG